MILLLVLLLMLMGCQNTDPSDEIITGEQDNIETNEELNNTNNEGDTGEKKPAIKDEKAVLEALDALAKESVNPSEINAFLKNHISNLGIDSANYALITYLEGILNYAGRVDSELLSPSYQGLAQETFGEIINIESLENVTDQGFIDTVEKIYANGLKVEKDESYYIVVVDFERLLKEFGNEIGEDIKSYIQLVDTTLSEDIDVGSKDEMNRVAMLIVEYDKYLKTYPNSMVFESVQSNRDWLRRMYFLESTCNEYALGTGENDYVLESFNDVIQFYPGTELEKLTQGFIGEFSKAGQNKNRVLEAFLEYYDEGISGTSLELSESKTSEGMVYPKFDGLETENVIERHMVGLLSDLKDKYAPNDLKDWDLKQTYDISYMDKSSVSVVFQFHLNSPKFPSLSIRDIEGHTYDFESGRVLNLEAVLPTEQESFTHLLADLRGYGKAMGFDMSGIDEDWTSVYKTRDGIVLYKGTKYTGHSAKILHVPDDLIAQWIDE